MPIERSVVVGDPDIITNGRVGGFEVIRLIGRGGMGEVYLARQVAMNREVALKVLSPEFVNRPHARERFLQEVHVLARLEHPHIVRAYDAGEEGTTCYLAMAYLPGSSLAGMLGPGTVIAERDALEMTRKLAAALDYAWTRFRVIHRDIKPANILFDDDGEPQLADMGLSKSLLEAEALTMSGAVMGTPNYMSPEQAEGLEDIDFRADIYSLGATLYHAVTGQMPFAGSSIMAVLRKQAMETLPDPREFTPELSSHCVGLLQIMLAKRPEDRYPDWKALIRDIDGVLSERPPSVSVPVEGHSVLIRRKSEHKRVVIPKGGLHPHGPVVPLPRRKRRMKTRDKALVFGAAAAIVVALTAAGLGLWISSQRAQERARAAEQARIAELREAERARESEAQAALWKTATDFAAANPDAYEQAIANFERAGRRLAGTQYELMALNEVARLRAERAESVGSVFAGLQARAAELADRGNHEAAAEVFALYSGIYAGDLAERRAAEEARYRGLAREKAERRTQAEEAARARERETVEAVAEAILEGRLDAAREACRVFLEDTSLPIERTTIERLDGWLAQAAEADGMLLASFEAQRGRQVTLTVEGEETPVRVLGIGEGRIRLERQRGVGWVTAELALDQIPPEERQQRVGAGLDPAVAGIWNGMHYLRIRRPEQAREEFSATGELSALLLAGTEARAAARREAAAQAAYARVLQAGGLAAEGLDTEAVAEIARSGRLPPAQADRLRRGLDAYEAAFGETSHAESVAPLIAGLRSALDAEAVPEAAPAASRSPAAGPVAGENWTSPATGMEFVWIPRMRMWVGKYEVTNGEYRRMHPDHNSGKFRGHSLNGDRQPVVMVNFDDAKTYAEWMTEQDAAGLGGARYRLPSEQEWETFARCGDNRTYPWGDEWPPPSGRAGNYHGQEGAGMWGKISGYNDGHPVSCNVEESWENPWGLFGVGGNVWEACAAGSSGRSFGAWRGASWSLYLQISLRVSRRGDLGGSTRDNKYGFRLVLAR